MPKRGESYCVVCGLGNAEWWATKHAFPKCPKLRAKWISILNLGNTKITGRMRVCGKHFAKSQYIRHKLTQHALPTAPIQQPQFVPLLCQGAVTIQELDRSLQTGNNLSTDPNNSGGFTSLSESVYKPLAPKSVDLNAGVESWDNKVNLVGHCVFCLELLSSSNTGSQFSFNPTLTSLEGIWPYIRKVGASRNDITANFMFHRGMTGHGESIFSSIPPMCSSCHQNVEVLNILHTELEEIRRKYTEQSIRLKSTAMKIRKTIEESSKLKRAHVENTVTNSNLPPPCISATTKFLNCLSESSVTPIAPKPGPMINSTANQNQTILVLDAASYVGQGFCSQVESVTNTTPGQLSNPAVVQIEVLEVKDSDEMKIEICSEDEDEQEEEDEEEEMDTELHTERYDQGSRIRSESNKLTSRNPFDIPSTRCLTTQDVGSSGQNGSKRSQVSSDSILTSSSDVKANTGMENLSDEEELIDAPVSVCLQSDFEEIIKVENTDCYDDPLA